MTPNEAKELLITLIAAESLPIEVIDISPIQNLRVSENLRVSDSTTEGRIKDVIHQWNTDGKIHTRPPGKGEIMKFYTKTDPDSPAKELLESLAVEALLESIIAEQKLPIRFTDTGFRLVTLVEDDPTRYPVKILHGGFRLEKKSDAIVQVAHFKGVADRFEAILKEKRTKAKLFHLGFRLKKDSETDMLMSQVKAIAKQINDTLNINYVLNSYSYSHSDGETSETALKSASICVSLWRFPQR